jgi:WD40 repeat protein
MLRRILILAMVALMLGAGAACTAQPVTSQPTTTTAAVTPSETTATQTAQNPTTKETTLENLPVLTAAIPGLIRTIDLQTITAGGPLWSPDSSSIVFTGFKPVTDGNFAIRSNAYLYSVADQKLTQITPDDAKGNFSSMPEPSWSANADTLAIAFTDFDPPDDPPQISLYNTQTQILRELPIFSWDASLSPDGSRLIFTDESGNVKIYDCSSGNTSSPIRGLQGYSPILFTDNQRLLYRWTVKPGLDSGEGRVDQIRLLNLNDPLHEQMLAPDSVYRSVRWLVNDQLALIEGGSDDGYRASLLNVASGKLVDLGERQIHSVCTVAGALRIIVWPSSGGNGIFDLYDSTPARLGQYSSDELTSWSVSILGLMPDNTLLCLEGIRGGRGGYLALASLNTDQYQRVAVLSDIGGLKYTDVWIGMPKAYPSPDGAYAAWIGPDDHELYVMDVQAVRNWLQDQ